MDRYESNDTMYTSPWCVGDMFIWCVSDLLPEILFTGLKEDRMSIVNLILSTLKTRVRTQQLTLSI